MPFWSRLKSPLMCMSSEPVPITSLMPSCLNGSSSCHCWSPCIPLPKCSNAHRCPAGAQVWGNINRPWILLDLETAWYVSRIGFVPDSPVLFGFLFFFSFFALESFSSSCLFFVRAFSVPFLFYSLGLLFDCLALRTWQHILLLRRGVHQKWENLRARSNRKKMMEEKKSVGGNKSEWPRLLTYLYVQNIIILTFPLFWLNVIGPLAKAEQAVSASWTRSSTHVPAQSCRMHFGEPVGNLLTCPRCW